MTSNFWVGKEVEGRFQGLPTLFIKGNQKIKIISEKLNKCSRISHLYFGAGNQSSFSNYYVIRHFIEKGYLVTYEIYLNDINKVQNDILESCHIIATIPNYNIDKLKLTDTVKIEGTNIYCMTKGQCYVNSRSLYNNDKPI